MQLSAASFGLAVARTAEKLGVELPAEYLDSLAHAAEVAAVVSAISTTKAGELHDAVIDAIDAGRDWRTDKNVAGLLAARQIAESNIEQTARGRADNELRDTLAAHADTILNGWADALEPQTAALEAAAEAYPDLDPNDADAAVVRGGDAMHHAHAVQVANQAWTAAVQGFGTLASVAHVNLNNQPALIYTPARAAEFAVAVEAARTARVDVNPQVLVQHGIPLRLANLTEYRERSAVFNADREAAQEAADEARLQRVADSW